MDSAAAKVVADAVIVRGGGINLSGVGDTLSDTPGVYQWNRTTDAHVARGRPEIIPVNQAMLDQRQRDLMEFAAPKTKNQKSVRAIAKGNVVPATARTRRAPVVTAAGGVQPAGDRGGVHGVAQSGGV